MTSVTICGPWPPPGPLFCRMICLPPGPVIAVPGFSKVPPKPNRVIVIIIIYLFYYTEYV